MLGLDNVVLQVSVEAVLVELIEIGRVEDRHVDIAGAEQVVDQHLFAIAAKFVERPHLLGRAQAAVKGVKAFDPALPVLVFPILGVGVPEMHVAIDDKDVVSVMFVHVSLLYWRALKLRQHRGAARSAKHDRMSHWPRAPRARCGWPRNGLAADPRKAACFRGRRSAVQLTCSRGRAPPDAANTAPIRRPTRRPPAHRRIAGSQSCRPRPIPRRAVERKSPLSSSRRARSTRSSCSWRLKNPLRKKVSRSASRLPAGSPENASAKGRPALTAASISVAAQWSPRLTLTRRMPSTLSSALRTSSAIR